MGRPLGPHRGRRALFPVALALPLVTAGDLHAQVLHNENGIEVRAFLRNVRPGAETCRVLEEHESAASYRQKIWNAGRPIDVWQLDYSVFNGSERPVDHLVATYRVEAWQPPCTIWGLSANAGVGGPVRVESAAGEILRGDDNPVLPGDTVTATSYIYVFRGHQAWLAHWQVNYEFAPLPPGTVAAPPPGTVTLRIPAQRVPSWAIAPAGNDVPEPPPDPLPVVDTFTDCPECPVMVEVPAGTYTMVAPVPEAEARGEEQTARVVTIEAPFAVGIHEVTFSEWDACVRAGGCEHEPDDEGWGRGNRPVINVHWEDIQTYLRWLSEQTGHRYRLPSEAEWEYVARAGAETSYFWGASHAGQCWYANLDDTYAPCTDDHEFSAPVGSFAPNAFGVRDVIGNVSEWTRDCWSESDEGAPADVRAQEADDCPSRVVRGGFWGHNRIDLGPVPRTWSHQAFRFNGQGFRVVRPAG